MKTKKVNILRGLLSPEIEEQFETLSNVSTYICKCASQSEKARKIFSAYGFAFGTAAAMQATAKAVKDSTFLYYSNLLCKSEKIVKNEKGESVTEYEIKLLPAIWKDEETAEILRKKGVKMIPLFNEFGVVHTREIERPVFKYEKFSYKNAKGETKTREIKVPTGESEKIKYTAYLKTRYKYADVINGICYMFDILDAETTTSAKLVREFEQMAKDNKNK